MDTRMMIYQGYLRKSPPEKKMDKDQWQKRYFKLWDDKKFEYYKTEKDKKPWKPAIDLSECLEVGEPKDLSKYYKNEYQWPFCLKLPGRIYYLLAKSSEDRKLWKEKICEQLSFGLEIRSPEYVLGNHSPHCSSNSSHSDEQRSGSDSSTTRTHSTRLHSNSTISDNEYEHSYDELPPPRSAGVHISASFGGYDRTYIQHVNSSPASGTSYPEGYKVLNDRISISPSFHSPTKRSMDMTQTDPDGFQPYVYAVPPSSSVPSNYVYDVPPAKSRLKQLSTKYPNTFDIGYIKMDPHSPESDGREDYIEMQGQQSPDTPDTPEYLQMHNEAYIQMHGTSPPSELIKGGSVKEFKPIGSTLDRVSTMPIKFRSASPKHTVPGRFANSIEEDVVFDEIPDMGGQRRSLSEIVLEPPVVDRAAKPCPVVDRSTKPKIAPVEDSFTNSPSGGTGCIYFLSPDSPDYENSIANDPLTPNEFVNKQMVYDINNNSRYSKPPDRKLEGIYIHKTLPHNRDGYENTFINTPLTNNVHANEEITHATNNNGCYKAQTLGHANGSPNLSQSPLCHQDSQLPNSSPTSADSVNDLMTSDINNIYDRLPKREPANESSFSPGPFQHSYSVDPDFSVTSPQSPDYVNDKMINEIQDSSWYIKLQALGLSAGENSVTSPQSSDYVNDKMINEIQDSSWYIKLQALGLSAGENLSTPAPYSSHKSCDDSVVDFHRTDEYTSNNCPLSVLYAAADEYLDRDLPPISPKFTGPDLLSQADPFVIEADDSYENVQCDYRIGGEHDVEDSYENVSDVNQVHLDMSELTYTMCSPLSARHNKTDSRIEEPSSPGNSYVKIDPFKSAAAKNLR